MTTTYPISAAYADGQVLSASDVNEIAGGVNDIAALQINAQTTSYTLVASDAAKLVTMTSASAQTITVPADATTNFAVGTQILVYMGSTGQVSVAGAAGVTINPTTKLKVNGQYGMACLMKLAANSWVFFGNIAA